MKVCNKCEDVLVTIVDGVFSGSEICLACTSNKKAAEDYLEECIKEEK